MLVFAWVVGIVLVGTRAKRILDEPRSSGSFWIRYFRFDLSTMLMSTLAAGLAFGFLQYGRIHWRWSFEALNSEELIVFNLLGILTGIQSLSCLWLTLTTRLRSLLSRAIVHFACLIVYGLVFSYSVASANLAASFRETLTFWLSGSIILVLVMMIGRWLSTKSLLSSQNETREASL